MLHAMDPNPAPARRRRWIAPLVIAGLALAGVVAVQSLGDLDRNIRAWLTVIVVLLGLLLEVLWLLGFSGLRWWQRLGTLGVLVAAYAAVKMTTRIEGAIGGTGIPRLVWRWAPTKDEQLSRAVVAAATAPRPAAVAAAEAKFSFPQFLGAGRDSRVEGVKLARDWAASPPKELWRHPVGLGWSGFVVVNGLAITQEQVGEDELVTACTLLTGAPVWAHTNRTRFREWQGGDGPRATPTIVGDRVYTYGATGILDCLELATGRLRWSVDVLKANGLNNLTWGKSSAPLVVDGRVIVSGGTAAEKGWLAYDADTGKPLWAANGEAANYASAVAATLAGRKQILVGGPQAVAGLEPSTGAVLWRHVWGSDKPPKCSQPLVLAGDRVFLSAGYAMGCQLIEVKAGADGSLQAGEVWRAKSMKTQFNNVAVRDGYLYGLDDGFLACVEIATGKRLWKDGRYGSGQSLLVGDLMLVQAEAGFVALAEAKPGGFQELGRLGALDSKTWNNPALAGPYLLVRNDHEAACYQLPLVTETASR